MKVCHTFYEEKEFGGSETYVKILRDTSKHDHYLSYVNKALQYRETFNNFCRGFHDLIEEIRDARFDIIHNHFFLSAFFCLERGLRSILTSHCMLSKEFLWSVYDADTDDERVKMQSSHLLFAEAERKMYPKINNIYVFSDFHRKEIESIGAKATKIPILMDVEYFGKIGKKEARKKIGIPNKFTILFSGRPTYYKGLHVLIDGINSLSDEDIQLLVLSSNIFIKNGRVVYAPCISTEKRTKYVSLHVFPKGQIIIRTVTSRKDLPDYYSASDIFVSPSLYESVGYANLEAMASGVPIIGSNTCGIPEFVKDEETGLLFEPGNHEDLVEKLIRLKEDKDLNFEISRKQKKFVAQFDVRDNVELTDRLYEEIK